MTVLTRREVDDGVRATLRFLSKIDFLPVWVQTVEEGFNPYSEHLKILESQVDE